MSRTLCLLVRVWRVGAGWTRWRGWRRDGGLEQTTRRGACFGSPGGCRVALPAGDPPAFAGTVLAAQTSRHPLIDPDGDVFVFRHR